MKEAWNANKTLIPLNLQLFADGPGGEKTEKPSSKRREETRKEGNVAKSIEITTAGLLLSLFILLKVNGSQIMESLSTDYINWFNIMKLAVENSNNSMFFLGLVKEAVMQIIWLSMPFMVVAFMVAFLTNVIQVGFHATLKPLEPKLNRFNPISGMKRIFSLKTIVELIKATLKLGLITIILYNTIKGKENMLFTLYTMSLVSSSLNIFNLAIDIGIKIGGFFIIIAALDYGYQRFTFERQIKMTKQEIKDESKMSEGNPEIKGAIRRKQQEMSQRRMMSQVPKADVIITNPTHFAVALQYSGDGQKAPVVVAKGADLVAARIKEVAKENNIEIVENKHLARTIYYSVEIGNEIPSDLYQAVAEILAFVYNLKNSKVGN